MSAPATAVLLRCRRRTPVALDEGEGQKLLQTAELMDLGYAVITSVTRDDLPDKGSGHFAGVIRTLETGPAAIEDRGADPRFRRRASVHLDRVLDAGPDVLAHNVETVPSPVSGGQPPQRRLSGIRCRSWRTAKKEAGSPRPG